MALKQFSNEAVIAYEVRQVTGLIVGRRDPAPFVSKSLSPTTLLGFDVIH